MKSLYELLLKKGSQHLLPSLTLLVVMGGTFYATEVLAENKGDVHMSIPGRASVFYKLPTKQSWFGDYTNNAPHIIKSDLNTCISNPTAGGVVNATTLPNGQFQVRAQTINITGAQLFLNESCSAVDGLSTTWMYDAANQNLKLTYTRLSRTTRDGQLYSSGLSENPGDALCVTADTGLVEGSEIVTEDCDSLDVRQKWWFNHQTGFIHSVDKSNLCLGSTDNKSVLSACYRSDEAPIAWTAEPSA